MKLSALTLIAGLLLLGSWPQIIIRNRADPDNPAQAAFTGADDFSAALNLTNWAVIAREGDQSNSEVQCYTSAQHNVTGGELLLTVQVVSSHTCSGHSYTRDSAMVQWKTFNFRYGTLTVRAKMAGGTGPWPAIWLLGSDCQLSNLTSADNIGACNWDQSGSNEFDVAEQVSSDTGHSKQGIFNAGAQPSCNAVVSDGTAYHIYQFIWSAGDAVWKIDGVQTCHLTSSVPSTPMFLIMNVALGGSGGSVVNGTLPQTMTVDYVTLSQP